MAQRNEDEARTQAPWSTGSDSSSSESPLPSLVQVPQGFRPLLICMTGSRKGVRFKLEKKQTILGRSRLADFPLDESAASRRHARITYENWDRPLEPPICYIEDLESRNGTELNGRPVDEVMRLKERDRVLIGRTLMGFFVRDAAELMHDEFLYENAMKDPLTGLDNRQQMSAHLKHFIARALRRKTEFCLLLIDVDHFKNVNDSHGHHVGDEALKHLAVLLQSSIRETDFVARWGGEEFVVGMTDASMEHATTLAERIRLGVEKNPSRLETLVIPMTVSIGVGVLQEGDTLESLFQRADRNLYAAKDGGRNRVVVTA